MKKTVIIGVSIFFCFSLIIFAFSPIADAAPVGWSDDQRLTNNSTNDDRVAIDAEGDRIHLAWHHTVTAGSDYQVYYINSSDGGWSWSNSQQISTSDLEAHLPDIGVNDTNIHIVWEDTKADAHEIFYRNSTDGGLSWNNEQRLSEDEGNASVGPYISVEEDDIHVIWTDERHSGTDVYYLRSLDSGISWDNGTGGQYGRRLTYTSGESTSRGIVKEGNTIHVLYTDYTDGDFDVYYTVSYDNGVNWEDGQGNSNQGQEIAGGNNDYAPAAIAVNGSTVHVVWCEEVWPGPEYYIWYRNSTDNGNNWNAARQLVGPSPLAWAPELACNESHVYMVWNDQRDDGTHSEVYIMNSTNAGGIWGTETRLTSVDNEHSGSPDIDFTDGKKYVVWVDYQHTNQEIYFKRSPDFIAVPEFSNLLLPITLMILTNMTVWRYRVWRKKHESK